MDSSRCCCRYLNTQHFYTCIITKPLTNVARLVHCQEHNSADRSWVRTEVVHLLLLVLSVPPQGKSGKPYIRPSFREVCRGRMATVDFRERLRYISLDKNVRKETYSVLERRVKVEQGYLHEHHPPRTEDGTHRQRLVGSSRS